MKKVISDTEVHVTYAQPFEKLGVLSAYQVLDIARSRILTGEYVEFII